MISAMKAVKQCVQATEFLQTSDPNPSESPTYDSLMHDHIHTSRMHHIHYYYLWVGSAQRAMCVCEPFDDTHSARALPL